MPARSYFVYPDKEYPYLLSKTPKYLVTVNVNDIKVYGHDGSTLSFWEKIFGSSILLYERYTVLKYHFVRAKEIYIAIDEVESKDGNQILIRVKEDFIYIGDEVYKFKPKKEDTILNLYSDITNKDDRLPYITGKKMTYFPTVITDDRMMVLKNSSLRKMGFYDKKDKFYWGSKEENYPTMYYGNLLYERDKNKNNNTIIVKYI